jgi:ATP-dependent Clp protease ATP-binding subunit ClpC
MFERFTDRARMSIVGAQEEARHLDHNYIGTEHLLLGLLSEREGVAARVLNSFGLTLEAARAEVVEMIGRGGDTTPSGHIPFTPRSKKVLELSLREALSLGHNYIGTEHILLGLIREGEGVAAQILVRRGAALDKVREAVVGELTRMGVPERSAAARRRHTPAADEAIAAAGDLAGSAPLGSQHLLEALARLDGSLAAKVLAELGVDPDDVAAKIDELGIEGTTDVTPEEVAARAMEVRVEGEEVHLVLRDAATVELARSISEKLGGPIRGEDPATSLIGLWQGTVSGLQDVRRQITPPEPGPDEGEATTGRSAIVRRALQSRLARRRRPSGS